MTVTDLMLLLHFFTELLINQLVACQVSQSTVNVRWEIFQVCGYNYLKRRSSGLSVGLSLGFTIACLSVDGKTPSVIEKLHIRETGSASSGSSRFINHVGAWSSEQCLAGAVLMTLMTSSGGRQQ